MEDDILVLNPSGEARVHSERFRQILKSKTKAGAVYSKDNLPEIPTPNRNELPDEEFVTPIEEEELVQGSESSADSDAPQKQKSRKKKKKKKPAKETSSDESNSDAPKSGQKSKKKKKKKKRVEETSSDEPRSDSDAPPPEKSRHRSKKKQGVDEAPKEVVDPGQASGSKRRASHSKSTTETYQPSVSVPIRPPSPKATRAKTYRRTLQTLVAEDKRDKWLEACEKILQHTFDPTNTSSQKQQEHIVAFWYAFLEEMFPDMSRNDYWKSTVVTKNWALFLTNMVQCAKGVDGGTIRSSTLGKWVQVFVALIGRYMVDVHGNRVGSNLLSRGLFQDIQYRYKWLVNKFKLNRHPPNKGYLCGRDLQAMFEFGFAKTEEYRRQSFLQTTAAALATFHAGLRVGSLGVTHIEWREKGLYPKLGDLELQVASPGFWDVRWDIKHRKGYNDTVEAAPTMNFHIKHVKQIHHLWFDLGLILASVLFLRGALEGIETVTDLFNCNLQKLKIKESKKNEPIFCKRTDKGRELTDDAASADSLLESLQKLGRELGLAVSNFHAIRRETANIFGIVLGAEVARRILGHGDDETTFDRNYSKNVWNYPLSEARLGDLDHTVNMSNQMAIMRNREESQIVDALLNAEKAELGDEDKKLTPAQKQEIAGDKEVKKLTELIDARWDHLFDLLPSHVEAMYGRATGNAEKIKKFVLKTDEYEEHRDEIDKFVDDIKLMGVKLREKKREVTRRLRRRAGGTAAERKAKFAEDKGNHTIEERSEIQERLTRPSKLFEPETADDDELASYLGKSSTLRANRDFLNPKFGNGLLAPNFVESLRDPDMYQHILKHGDRSPNQDAPNEEEAAFDQPMTQDEGGNAPQQDTTPSQDPETFHEEQVPAFDDSKEKPIFTGDFFKIRMLFFCRLIAPVLRAREEKRLFDKDKGWKCGICVALKEFNPAKGNSTFDSRALLRRHQDQMHSPWDDLPILMFTEDEEIFKCPFETCSFTAESIQEVRFHCLNDCIDHLTFRKMKLACVRDRREGIDEQTRRELARKLKVGKPLSAKSVKLFEELKAASQSDIKALAQDINMDDEALPYRFQALQAALKMIEQSIDFESETITDKNAENPVDMIHERWVSPAFLQKIQDEVELRSIEPNLDLDYEWLIPDSKDLEYSSSSNGAGTDDDNRVIDVDDEDDDEEDGEDDDSLSE